MSAFLERWTGVVLRDPAWLLLLLLLPAALFLRRRRGEPAVLFAPAALHRPALPTSRRAAMRSLPLALGVVGISMLVVALARPVERAFAADRTLGVDLVLCLDVSSSMSAEDLGGPRAGRLAAAKEAAARFVRERPDDRIGLVAFARYADLLCPPTVDHEALARILEGVGPVASDGPEDATGIGTAVARAVQVLGAGGARSRAVVLLTDGEENVAVAGAEGEIAPAHAAQLAERLGVRVHAVVVGGPPGARGGRPPPDTRPVEAMATRTGGSFHAAADARALGAVYARIDRLERAPLEEPRPVLEDRFTALLVAGVVLLLLGRLLGASRFGALP